MPVQLTPYVLVCGLSFICGSSQAGDALNGKRLFFQQDQRLQIDSNADVLGRAGGDIEKPTRDWESKKNTSIRQRPTLTFNGVLSSGVDTVFWINGMPLREDRYPAGIRRIFWHEASARLVVQLNDGSKYRLLPGESVTLASDHSRRSNQTLAHR